VPEAFLCPQMMSAATNSKNMSNSWIYPKTTLAYKAWDFLYISSQRVLIATSAACVNKVLKIIRLNQLVAVISTLQ